ncbi:MAG TPA: aspartyl-phosphate phosphatase Spo0E family protein [Bacillota bacterium]|jgi:iron-sulfur cluster repair protein YtfE (RIC family)|nr:aspartyl-phosphate phosphatase Spo0E family protein [Bacillota bacterium]
MEKIEEVLMKIDELRKKMNDMIAANDDLLDSKIIELSRLLDEQLVEYHRLLKEKNV